MKRILPLALLAFACAHQATQPRRYTVLMAGNAAGMQIVTASGDEVVVD